MNTKTQKMKQFAFFGKYGAVAGAILGLIVFFSLWMRQFYPQKDDKGTIILTNLTENQIASNVNQSRPKIMRKSVSGYGYEHPLILVAEKQFIFGYEDAALQTIETIESTATKDLATQRIINSIIPSFYDDIAHPITQDQIDKALPLINRLEDDRSRLDELLRISTIQFGMGKKDVAKKTLAEAKDLAFKTLENQEKSNDEEDANATLSQSSMMSPMEAEDSGKVKGKDVESEESSSSEEKSVRFYGLLWPVAFSVFGFLLTGMLQPILEAIGKVGGRSLADAAGMSDLKRALEK